MMINGITSYSPNRNVQNFGASIVGALEKEMLAKNKIIDKNPSRDVRHDYYAHQEFRILNVLPEGKVDIDKRNPDMYEIKFNDMIFYRSRKKDALSFNYPALVKALKEIETVYDKKA